MELAFYKKIVNRKNKIFMVMKFLWCLNFREKLKVREYLENKATTKLTTFQAYEFPSVFQVLTTFWQIP